MITIDDIQLFVATSNRANFLAQSLDSLLHQSIGVKEIIVLDNESTDNTEQLVKSLANKGIKHVKTYGFLGNYKKCKDLASKKYCMLFHDNDLVHPKYLEFAIALLNKYPDLSIITTRYIEFCDENVPAFSKEISNAAYIFKHQKEFAEFLYYKEIVAYATAIYKTECFKQCPLEYEKFNKFNDWPFMVKMAGYGKSAILKDPNLFFVRRHSGQDTWTQKNTPSIEQIINWDLFFKKALNANKNIKSYDKFIKRYKHFLLGKYNAFLSAEDKEKTTPQDIINLALRNGIESFDNKIIRFIYNLKLYFKNFIKFIFQSKD